MGCTSSKATKIPQDLEPSTLTLKRLPVKSSAALTQEETDLRKSIKDSLIRNGGLYFILLACLS
jgi:hypothetical protein